MGREACPLQPDLPSTCPRPDRRHPDLEGRGGGRLQAWGGCRSFPVATSQVTVNHEAQWARRTSLC